MSIDLAYLSQGKTSVLCLSETKMRRITKKSLEFAEYPLKKQDNYFEDRTGKEGE